MHIAKRNLVLGIAAIAVGFAAPAGAQDIKVLSSMPNLGFPFFVHMMKQVVDEGDRLGVTVIESDGQGSTPKQTADVEAAIIQGVDGILISPNEVDAMAPAIRQAIEAGIPVVTVDRRVDQVEGILAHVGADNVKGGEAQGNFIVERFPDGAAIFNLQGQPGASPAIDRNKGVHEILDPLKDKYPIIFEQTAFFARDKGLSVTEAGLAGAATPPDVIVAANDDMALGAAEAVKAAGLDGKVAILGFDALPEALAAVRDGRLAATVEQFPGAQAQKGLNILVDKIRDNKDPEHNLVLMIPITIAQDNLEKGERIGELN